MSYFDEVKQPGEIVAYDKRLHWIVYWRAIGISVVLAAVMTPLLLRDGTGLLAAVIGIIIIAVLGRAIAKRYATEIIVTNTRVILKTGIFMRNTMEMNMTKIESVDVNQSVLGRFANYGTVVIRGIGSSYEPLAGVDAPIQLRNSILMR